MDAFSARLTVSYLGSRLLREIMHRGPRKKANIPRNKSHCSVLMRLLNGKVSDMTQVPFSLIFQCTCHISCIQNVFVTSWLQLRL